MFFTPARLGRHTSLAFIQVHSALKSDDKNTKSGTGDGSRSGMRESGPENHDVRQSQCARRETLRQPSLMLISSQTTVNRKRKYECIEITLM